MRSLAGFDGRIVQKVHTLARSLSDFAMWDAAIAWLESSIPARYLPPQVQNETVFASLKSREGFQGAVSAR